MESNILIIGCGSQARYIIENYRQQNDLSILGLVDCEDGKMIGKMVNNIEVICSVDEVTSRFNSEDIDLVIGYGNNSKKKELVGYFKSSGFKFASVINPRSYLSDFIQIGEGVIINANVSIMPNAKIGDFVIIHSNTVIEHDNIIGDYVNIGPGVSLAGNVRIGDNSYIYTGSTVIPKISIGNDVIVGAGSVVINNISDGEKIAGVPARSIVKRS